MARNDSKTVTMMQLRHHIGEVVNDVVYTNMTYVIEKHGKPICSIQPYQASAETGVEPEKHRAKIRGLFGALKHIQTEPADWTKEYADIERAYDKRMRNIWKSK